MKKTDRNPLTSYDPMVIVGDKMETLKLKKGNVVARVTNRQDGNRDLSVYLVKAAGTKTVQVRSYGTVSTTVNWGPDHFTVKDSFVMTERAADSFVADMRKALNNNDRATYFDLVERTVAAHMS
jgi:hypothetical protein